ncbi:MAG: hypothetical protein ACJZZ7_01830 [Cytophagales bacterium]
MRLPLIKVVHSVSLSSDGTTVAIGADWIMMVMDTDAGHVRVYEWDGSSMGSER